MSKEVSNRICLRRKTVSCEGIGFSDAQNFKSYFYNDNQPALELIQKTVSDERIKN